MVISTADYILCRFDHVATLHLRTCCSFRFRFRLLQLILLHLHQFHLYHPILYETLLDYTIVDSLSYRSNLSCILFFVLKTLQLLVHFIILAVIFVDSLFIGMSGSQIFMILDPVRFNRHHLGLLIGMSGSKIIMILDPIRFNRYHLGLFSYILLI